MRPITALAVAIVLTTAGAAVPASAGTPAPATGDFTVAVEFASLSLVPVGTSCALTVEGEITFSGSVTGTASGVTSALVLAPCADVAAHPPGTFPDLFRADVHLNGALDGDAVAADIVYAGRTAAGGDISGLMVFSGDITGVASIEATLGVGGTYAGIIVAK